MTIKGYRGRVSGRCAVAVAAVVLLGMAAPIKADLRLERMRTVEVLDRAGNVDSSRERTEMVFIGERSARLDLGPGSVIVRMDDGIYLWLDHPAKAYVEVTLPLTLESFLTDQEQQCFQQSSQSVVDVDATVTLTDERRVIDQRQARKLRVAGRHPIGFQIEREEWLTQSLSVDLAPYHQVLLYQGELSPASRGWKAEALAAGGYAVESTLTLRSRRGGVRVNKQRLVAVKEVPFEASRYHPPADYAPTLSRPPLDVACGAPDDLPHPERSP